MGSFKNKLPSSWLSVGHPAPTGLLFNPAGAQIKRLNVFCGHFTEAQTAELLAVVGPNHCLDGWSYISRAIEALLSGDGHAARHLSYYAQLRAALSILAISGVGIFNGLNFSIDNAGARHDLGGGGTHTAAWEALESLAAQPTQAQWFYQTVGLRGVSLKDSIDAIWPSAPLSGLVSDMVQTWGLDLREGQRARSIRNISSYNPHNLNSTGCAASEAVTFVREAWRVLEPVSVSGFDELDRFLLRRMLQKVHFLLSGNQLFQAGAIDSRYDRLDPRVTAAVPKDFLLGIQQPNDPDILEFARMRPSGDPLGMASRALLLLRMATAYVRTALKESGCVQINVEMEPWFSLTGTDRGFWTVGQSPQDMADLWDDIRIALVDWEVFGPAPPTDYSDLMSRSEKSMRYLAQGERAFMWGLGT